MRLRKYSWILVLLIGFALFGVAAHNFAPTHAEDACAIFQFTHTPTVADGMENAGVSPEFPSLHSFELPTIEISSEQHLFTFSFRGPPA